MVVGFLLWTARHTHSSTLSKRRHQQQNSEHPQLQTGGSWQFLESADLAQCSQKKMMNISKSVNEFMQFNEYLWSIRDQRVDNWPMMNSAWPTVSLCIGYIYISVVLGPALMKDRQPFDLKRIIMAYNLFQVVFSAYVFYEGSAAGWLTGYNWLCQDIDRDANPDSKGTSIFIFMLVFYLLSLKPGH